MLAKQKKTSIANRFRGLLPIVIDVETSGLHPETDALLEIAAVPILMNPKGEVYPYETYAYHIEAFQGARIDPEALELTGIDPDYPLRYAIPEQQALHRLFGKVRVLLEREGCKRAVLVGHNAWFDLSFLLNAAKRSKMGPIPFHSFTSFDTATMAAVAMGETVLAKAMRRAGISFNVEEAHSAIYDAEKTAELFCHIINHV